MAIAQTRCVLVDDTDPSIQYAGGPWFQDTNATDNLGYVGLSERSTESTAVQLLRLNSMVLGHKPIILQ